MDEYDEDIEGPFPSVPGYTNYPNYNPKHRNTSTSNPGYTGSGHGEALALEAELHPNESTMQRAKRLLRENVDGAASVLIEIALHGSTEKLRLEASKLILDRTLGPVANVQPDATDNPLEQLFKDLERAANG